MKTKIFQAPKEIKLPKMTFQNVSEWSKLHSQYIENLKKHLISIGYTGKNVGEVIKFPVGDGYAQYMVASMRPLRLIHLKLGDVWKFEYADRLTAKDVQDKIDQVKAIRKIFTIKPN